MTAVSSSTHCRNCGTFLGEPAGNFCPHCGQDTLNHPPSFWEFIHEFVTHYVALEGKLWKTLVLLFFKPAQLTREYREGRKQRYISPLRLYITASFLFFLVFKVFDIGSGAFEDYDSAHEPSKAMISFSETKKTPEVASAKTEQPEDPNVPSTVSLEGWKKNGSFDFNCNAQILNNTCHWLQKRLKTKYQDKTEAQMWAGVRVGVASNLPYAIFFSLPFFALLTKLLYIRRGYYFGEHFVYALHIHAFTFFVMLMMALISSKWVVDLLAVLAAAYYLIGLQRFFGGRWWMNILRYGAIAMIYPTFLSVAAATLLVVVFLS